MGTPEGKPSLLYSKHVYCATEIYRLLLVMHRFHKLNIDLLRCYWAQKLRNSGECSQNKSLSVEIDEGKMTSFKIISRIAVMVETG